MTALSNICERRHGLHSSVCDTKSKTLFGMLRRVCTIYNYSDAFYTSADNDLMHGECQGKTSSPPSWAIYTITLPRALGFFNPGITLQCVEGERSVHCPTYMFVNEKDMGMGSAWDEKCDGEIPEPMAKFRKATHVW